MDMVLTQIRNGARRDADILNHEASSQTEVKHEGDRDNDRSLGGRTTTLCDMIADGDRLWSI